MHLVPGCKTPSSTHDGVLPASAVGVGTYCASHEVVVALTTAGDCVVFAIITVTLRGAPGTTMPAVNTSVRPSRSLSGTGDGATLDVGDGGAAQVTVEECRALPRLAQSASPTRVTAARSAAVRPLRNSVAV